MLASGKRGRRWLNKRRRVAESIETPLLGQQLLVRHWIDGMWEAERGAGQQGKGNSYLVGKCEWRCAFYKCVNVCVQTFARCVLEL